jgi:hypothetical protein
MRCFRLPGARIMARDFDGPVAERQAHAAVITTTSGEEQGEQHALTRFLRDGRNNKHLTRGSDD